MMRLKAVMLQIIANDVPRSSERRDHAPKGDLANYRECHIGRDFLLIYCFDDSDRSSGGTVYFTRVCTHAQLFR